MATAACLAGELAPPALEDACSPRWRTKGCLRSEVAAWGPSYERVQACFRCCMLEHTTPFAAQRSFWSNQLLRYAHDPWSTTPYTLGQQLGVEGPASVLLGVLSPMLVTDVGATYANRSLVSSNEFRSGRQVRGGTLVSVLGWTAHAQTAMHTLWRHWPQLAKPVTLYTMGDPPLPLERDMHQLERSELRTWWVSNAHAAHKHPKVALWPRGLKFTHRWPSLLAAAAAKQSSRIRKHLLFCGCMSLTSHPERRQKLAALRANGFTCAEHKCAAGEGSYAGLLDARFTACPRGAGAQNHREWEALLAGSHPPSHPCSLQPLRRHQRLRSPRSAASSGSAHHCCGQRCAPPLDSGSSTHWRP